MRTYKVRPDKTTDGGACFVAAFDDAPDIGVQGTTANEAVETLLSLAGKLPVTAPTPERRVGEERLMRIADHAAFAREVPVAEVQSLALDLLSVRADNDRLVARRDQAEEQQQIWMGRYDAIARQNDRLTAEVERLRKFAEKMISPCEWGPSAFIEEDEADISDWAVSCGILVERVHAQPCEVEGCECDGSPTLLHFAWSPEAAALSLAPPPPEDTE